MATAVINKSKVAHWQQFSTCLENQKIISIVFDNLDEPNLKQIISILDKQPKILELVTKISFVNCGFGKSSNTKFTKLVTPSVKSLIFKRSRFVDDGAVVCAKIQKISSLEEVSFFETDLRRAYKALCSLILKGHVNVNLKLIQTSLSHEYCKQLFETMKICSNLKSLKLHNVEYSLDTMVESIAANTSLTKLDLYADDYPYAMKALNKANPKTNLVELQLRGFFWQDIKDSTFFEDIRYYHNLTKLVVNNTYFQSASEQLAQSLKHLTNLKSLDITNSYAPELFIEHIISSTSITDMTIEGENFRHLITKCQSVNSSVKLNFSSLSLDYNWYTHGVKETYLETVLSTWQNLTKLQLSEISDVEVSQLINGLNSVNCRLTELEIIRSRDRASHKLSDLLIGLGKNTTITKLSFKYNSPLEIDSLCELLRVNKTIQSLVLIETPSMSLKNFKDLLEALKVNKTLLYLEMTVAERDFATDLIAHELCQLNSTLLYLEPFANDYRVDLWLHQNRKLRVNMSVILHNIMRSGSILPLEIWLKIFEYLGYSK